MTKSREGSRKSKIRALYESEGMARTDLGATIETCGFQPANLVLALEAGGRRGESCKQPEGEEVEEGG